MDRGDFPNMGVSRHWTVQALVAALGTIGSTTAVAKYKRYCLRSLALDRSELSLIRCPALVRVQIERRRSCFYQEVPVGHTTLQHPTETESQRSGVA